MIRYEEVPEHVINLFNEVQTRHFPELRNAEIAILYDLKPVMKGGRIQLGQIRKPNDLIRHFTKDDAIAIDGYDYIIILDQVCFESVQKIDRERIIRHELRHAYYDIESEDNPYKLVDHSITDFYEEVELNREDPRWVERCARLTADIYEQRKEEAKDQKKRKKKAAREYQIHPKQGRIEDAVDRFVDGIKNSDLGSVTISSNGQSVTIPGGGHKADPPKPYTLDPEEEAKTPAPETADSCEGCPMRDWSGDRVDAETDGYYCRAEQCVKEGVTVEEKAAIQEKAPTNGSVGKDALYCRDCTPKGYTRTVVGVAPCYVCHEAREVGRVTGRVS